MLLLFFCIETEAQTKNRKSARKAQQAKVEPNPADVLYDDMLGATAKVVFIDSVVTDKEHFLSAIPLSKECGFINTYDAFWNTNGNASAYTYMNEFGNKVMFSQADTDGHTRLFTSDKLNGQWSSPKVIDDFGDDFEDINCPYMMSDGVTLYFSAKGKNGVGGYDLYVTMYDSDSARFYKPENIGLPYNSKANDYCYVVDDFNSLGWLVTDRNQPEGKVCVYTFIPLNSRQTYNEDETDEEHLRALASISRISDTWTDEKVVQEARKRLALLRKKNSATEQNTMSFIVNDNVVYTNPSDFKNSANRQRYAKLVAAKAELPRIEAELDNYRRQYSTASKADRRKLSPVILKAEQQTEQFEQYIKSLEKQIRNTENTLINK